MGNKRNFTVLHGVGPTDKAVSVLHNFAYNLIKKNAADPCEPVHLSGGSSVQRVRFGFVLERVTIEGTLREYNAQHHVDDATVSIALAFGFGEGLNEFAPEHKASLFVGPVCFGDPASFQLMPQDSPFWEGMVRDGPKVGIAQHTADVAAYYHEMMGEGR